MKKKINPHALEKRYIEFLRKHGISPSNRSAVSEFHHSQIANEIMASGRQEGNAGELLSKHFSRQWTEDKIHSKGHTLTYNELIEGLCTELERGLDVMQIHLPMSVFIGEFPTGSLNAQVLPIEDWALVLINKGVFDFLWRITKLQALCVQKHDPITGESWPKNRLDQTKAIAIFADCLQCYLNYGTIVPSGHIPLVGGLRTVMLVNQCRECERFVIAHEIGHIANGDLKAGTTRMLETQCGGVRFFNKYHQQEFAADLFAVRLLLRIVPLDLPPKAKDNYTLKFMKASNAATAPLLFFAIDSVITYAAEILFGDETIPPITDHPRSEQRIERIRNELVDLELGKPFLDDVDATVEWVINTGRAAVERISWKC